jgi:predicted  nucleic acid-binding Zn-ribbon protein
LQRQVEALQAALTDERQAAQDLQRQVEALQAALTDERQAAHRRIEQLDFELRQMREFTDRLRSILRV